MGGVRICYFEGVIFRLNFEKEVGINYLEGRGRRIF